MNLQTVSDIDETTQHRLLADEQRRFVIRSLQTARNGVDMTLDEITAHLERAVERTGSEQIGSRRDLRCRLHHVHLPMLAAAGLLDYDAKEKRVSLGAPWAVTAPAETL
ncbi:MULTISPECIES: DUF7344 domain-containing protein [Haloarcula]|uniref:DUF7344 domain-containing protein n=1 Tax=Haloarcula TaxID=2237 RepID=UPI0023E8C558|nr:hypothetical protein [Halomicroarcula sp. SHR3]